MSQHIPKEQNGDKGTWWPAGVPWKANVVCPDCGGRTNLRNHQVDEHGRVSPSLICPFGCGFHESVVLDGWEA